MSRANKSSDYGLAVYGNQPWERSIHAKDVFEEIGKDIAQQDPLVAVLGLSV